MKQTDKVSFFKQEFRRKGLALYMRVVTSKPLGVIQLLGRFLVLSKSRNLTRLGPSAQFMLSPTTNMRTHSWQLPLPSSFILPSQLMLSAASCTACGDKCILAISSTSHSKPTSRSRLNEGLRRPQPDLTPSYTT